MVRVTGIDRDGNLRDVGFLEGTIDGIRKTLEEIGWKILYIGYEESKENAHYDRDHRQDCGHSGGG